MINTAGGPAVSRRTHPAEPAPRSRAAFAPVEAAILTIGAVLWRFDPR